MLWVCGGMGEREDDGVGSSFPVFKIFFFQFSTVQFSFININWAFDVTIHRVNKPEDRSRCQSHKGGYWKQQYRKIYPSLLFLPCFLFSFLSFLSSFFHFFYTPQLYWDMIDIQHCISLRCTMRWFDLGYFFDLFTHCFQLQVSLRPETQHFLGDEDLLNCLIGHEYISNPTLYLHIWLMIPSDGW